MSLTGDMKRFFEGECGFSRLWISILLLYILGKDSQIAKLIFGI